MENGKFGEQNIGTWVVFLEKQKVELEVVE